MTAELADREPPPRWSSPAFSAAARRRFLLVLLCLSALLLLLATLACAFGSVPLSLASLWRDDASGAAATQARLIVLELRLPATCTAALAGASLAVSGLQLQTYFRNPLAGPFVLGVDSGAALGVALMLIALPAALAADPELAMLSDLGLSGAAIAGAAATIALVLMFARNVLSDATLIVAGLMLSLLLASMVSLLLHYADPFRLQAFVLWTFGTFAGVPWQRLPAYAALACAGLALAIWDARSLNALQLGQLTASTLGVNHHHCRRRIIASTALLAGATVAYCGPLGVIGTAAPHIARGLLRSADHRQLMPVTAAVGAALTLLADLLSRLLANEGTLPLNAVLAVLSAPVVIAVLVRSNRSGW
ncbi:MAG: Hemin transport system permease protein HmuU [Gammaproteobacteria bacterium]|nr:Hemin transport system permease protein HmuU [Gammaproteobacteria bacterium]